MSASSAAALPAQAARLHAHLTAHPELSLADVAYSLATTRAQLDHRAAIVAHDRDTLLASLDALASGRSAPGVVLGQRGAGKLAVLFTGQGSQRPGMALGLLDTAPVFADAIATCERALAPHVDWSLTAVLRGAPGAADLERVDVVQPVLFSVMVALAALWRSLGVEPAAVIGHSQGEIAAAHVAGALSLDDAARIVALRSRALIRIAGHGAMAAVELGARELAAHIAALGPLGLRLAIAATNSPTSSVVSGDPEAIDALLARLTAAQIFARKVRVDYASHSHAVEAIREQLLVELAGIAPRAVSVPLYSTVTGGIVDGSALDATYWYQNLRQTVRFSDAVDRLLADGHRSFVEISPHPVLGLAVRELIDAAALPATVVGSLRRDDGRFDRLLLSWAELQTRGLPLDWAALAAALAPIAPRRVALPTYAFDRQRFWIDVPAPNRRPPTLARRASRRPTTRSLGAAIRALADSDGFCPHRPAVRFLADHPVARRPRGVRHRHRPRAPRSSSSRSSPATASGLPFGSTSSRSKPRSRCRRTARSSSSSRSAPPTTPDSRSARPARPRPTMPRHDSGVDPAYATRPARPAPPSPPGSPELAQLAAAWRGRRCSTDGSFYARAGRGRRRLRPRVPGPPSPPGAAATSCSPRPRCLARGGDAHAEAARFGLHPALLDAALHALGLASRDAAAEPTMPFAWSGVTLYAHGASRIRVRLARRAGEISLADRRCHRRGPSPRSTRCCPPGVRRSAPGLAGSNT